MTQGQQPLALKLADAFADDEAYVSLLMMREAAAELRRQHARILELEAELEAVGAGGTLIKPAQETFWGGYAGYFADPDGHLWEVAHNPFWRMDDEGRVRLPGREMS